ncbi:hypothetical protein H4R33_007017 [Dimargaris cristalligena]|nr:hypothetical protein H4R33_007017 [Dimargaris cristalligena]
MSDTISDRSNTSSPAPKVSTQSASTVSTTTGPADALALTDTIVLIKDELRCASHRLAQCTPCDVDFRDQNLMTKNLEANQGRLPPPHPQMGQTIQHLKSEGNTAYRNKDYAGALAKYTDALTISRQRPIWDPAGLVVEETSVLLNNRVACLLELEQYHEALFDAEIVTRVKHSWAKGHFRKGRALYGMERYRQAAHSFELGCALDSDASEMKTYLHKCYQMV